MTDNRLRFYDVSQNRNIFKINRNNIKSVTNNKVVYSKLLSSQSVTGSTATLTLTSPNKFVGPLGSTISSTIKRDYYTIVVKSVSSGTYTTGRFVPTEDVTMSVDSTGTQLSIAFGGNLVSGTIDVIVSVENDTLARRTKTLVENQSYVANIIVGRVDYSVLKSDVFNYKGIYKIGENSNVFVGNYSSGTSYAANNLVQANGLVYYANASSTGQSLTNAASGFILTVSSS